MQSRFVRKLFSGLLAFIMMFTMMADGLVLFAQEVQGDDIPLVGEYVETPETPEGQVTPLLEGDYTVTVFQPDGYLVPNMDMQFFARFDPEPAEVPAVTWSVENITGEATISESGVLSAIAAGTVRVSLVVEDGSGKTASLDVEIQSPEDYGSVGSGTAEDPYHVRTAADLDAVRNDLGAYYTLDNGIVFSEADFAEGGAFYNGGLGWEPIGTESAPFTGAFYGNGYTITGLKITISDAAETTYGGLFGYISSATVENLGMVDGSISVGTTGSLKVSYAGAIAGYALNESVISGCYNTGSVSTSSYGGVTYAGGIVGSTFFNNGETEIGTVISDCHNTGDISASTNSTVYAGGIAGYTDTMTYSVMDSYNTGDISAVTTGSSKSHAAGISGGNNRGSVFRCYNTGYIYAETENEMAQAAGITDSVGSTWSGLNGRVCSVSECYNTGTVEAVSESNSFAAGILSFRSSGGEIANCYNVGAVKVTGGGASYSKVADGICAHRAASDPGPVTNCYSAKGAAKTATDATLVNADDMKASSTFQGFDFGSVWTMGGSADYPYPELQRMDMAESIVTSVEITAPKTSVYAGATMQLGIVGDLPVVWSVVDGSSWGTVDANGLLTAKNVPVDGSVTLRATYAENGAFTDDITIQVLKNMAGSGTAEDPYVIYTTSELGRIRDNLAAHYKLGGDITFSFSDFAEGGAFYNEGLGWAPIGTSEAPFTGSFDGAGYSIVGLRCTAGSGKYIGLFAYAQDAEIKNVTLSGGYIQGGLYTCGLVSYAKNCTITSCENRNVIEGGSGSAGLVAVLIGGTATYLQNSGLIKGGYEVGGVVSHLYSGAVLSNSGNSGTVRAGTRSGGVVCMPNESTVSQCYNSGTIDVGDNYYAGGIAYKVYDGSSLLDCYNYGTVRAGDNIGGIACEMYSGDSTIQRCYNRGTIESETNYFVSAVLPSLGAGSSIKNCYMSENCGATDQYATVVKGNDIWVPAKYAGLDFDNVWQIGNIYPELRNVPAADPVILVSEITVAGASSVAPGETAQYSAAVLPNNAENANVEWSIVSGSECGSIDENGLFTAVAAGTVTIRATAKDYSDVYGEITVAVEILAESISITAEKDLIYDNETLQLSIAAAPEGAAVPEVTWSIVSGKAYANIDENGLLTPIAGGIVVIEAAANDDSGLFAEFTLTIIPERGNGTEAHPYLISTKEELNAVRNDLDANYVLENDIEFTEADFAEGGAFYNSGSGWQPIGSEAAPFTGTFDGAGYAIKGLKINIESDSAQVYAGLFGYISGATIKNLGVEDGSVTASSDAESANVCAGAIAGYAIGNSTITDCYNTGSVTASSDDGKAYAGGIAGLNAKMYGGEGGAITGCYNTGSVSASATCSTAYAGGVAGYADYGSIITNCYNVGGVEASKYSGGIAGFGDDIYRCFNVGDVTVTGTATSGEYYAGGIVGMGNGSIQDCYNLGSVNAEVPASSVFAGGITACKYGDSIYRCYNAGDVTSTKTAGGIAASKISTVTVTNCYTMSGSAASSGSGTVLTLEKMKQQASFSNFDFTSVWTMDDDTANPFPELQFAPCPAVFSTGVSIAPLSAPLRMGRAVQLHAVTTPADAMDKDIVWSVTEGEEFASLDENGVLTAIAVGTVTVRATTPYTDAYSEMQVTVGSYRGTGTAEDPFTIYNKDELYGMRFVPDAHYVLANDIEFTEADFAESGAFYNEGKGWEPIGSGSSNAFTGGLDGAGYAIKGLKISIESSTYTYAGLFGYISGATVKNIGLVNNDIAVYDASGELYAGAIAGYVDGSTITDCYNTGSVTVINNSTSTDGYTSAHAGGIAGDVDDTTITNCYNTGSVTAINNSTSTNGYTYDYAGGIAGDVDDTTITNCYNIGSVTVINNSTSTNGYTCAYAGGVVGYAYSSAITDCYNTGSVTVINNSTSTNGDTGACAGGVAGYASSSTITDCYNTGYVTATVPALSTSTYAYAGGIAGDVYDTTITNCYIMEGCASGTGENGTVLTAHQMAEQASFVGFDFDSVWTMAGNEAYPCPELIGFDYAGACAESIQVSAPANTVKAGTKLQFAAAVSPENAAYKGVSWSISSGSEYGSIDENGLFSAAATGTVTVRASVYNCSSIYDEMTIEVLPVVVTIRGEDSVMQTKTLQLSATVTSEGAESSDVVWSIASGAECGSIDENGTFTATAVGTVTVRATANGYTGIYGEMTIEVTPVMVSGITIEGEGSVVRTKTLQLSAAVLPENAYNSEVEWSVVSGEECGSIDQNGLFTANANGTVTIRATAKDGSGIYGEKTIQITPLLLSSIVIEGEDSVVCGNQLQLSAIVDPEDADNTEIAWSIASGEEYAEIDENGLLTPIAGGVVTVRATAKDGSGIFAEFTVTVVPEKGNGSEEYPYLISTKEELNAVRNDLGANYALENDIEFTEADFAEGGAFCNGGSGWQPIGGDYEAPFTGTFDGAGYAIKGLKINIESSSTTYAGLFGYISGATVKNLGMEDGAVTVSSDNEIAFVYGGAIAGYAAGNSSIIGCYNTGEVNALSENSYAHAGGIAGSVFTSAVDNCYNTGSIYASTKDDDEMPSRAYTGGIASTMRSSTVSDCYNAGSVIASNVGADACAGGISAFTYDNSIIKNCYNVGGISASTENPSYCGIVGGIASYADANTVANCYSLEGNGGNCEEGTVLDHAQMIEQTSYADFDFDSTWTMGGDESYPYPELVGLDYAGQCVANIEVTAPSNTVETGSQLQFTAAVSPENAAYKAVGWSIVSGEECGSIDYNGLFTASAVGTVTVRATARDYSGVYGEMTIEVTPIMVSGITIEGEGSVVRSKTLQLSAVVTPADASNTDVVWSIVSGSECGSIDENGLFTANVVGYATVRATAKDGSGIYDDKTIQITPLLLSSIQIEGEDSVIRGQKLQMSAVVSPENADNTGIEWSVNSHANGGNGTIDENGLFTATATGQVYIYATAKDGSGTLASKRITVLPILTETVEITGDDTVMRTKTLQLSAAAYPETADNTDVEWSVVSGEEFGLIDENGLFTAIANGTVTVRAAAKDGSGVYSEKTVEVTPLLVESIEVESASDSVMRTKTLQMSAIVLPAEANNTDVIWSIVSGEEFGLVDENGLFTAVANGTVTVRASAKDGSEVYGEKTIEVVPLLVDSIFIHGEREIERGDQMQMTVSVYPTGADNTEVEWSVIPSTGNGTIDENGLFTATDTGALTVRATAKDGSGVYDQYTVKVVPILVSSINIDWDGRGFLPGETHQFTASVLPADADDTGIRWSIADEFAECADITEDGCFRAWNPGTVVVRAETLDGSVFSEITMEIFERTIVVNGNGVDELLSGKTLQLKASYNPDDSVTGGFVWSVPEEYQQYITVSSSGLVTALDVAERTTAVVKVSSTRPGTGYCEYTLTILPVVDSVILTLDGERLGATGEPVETLQDIDIQKTPTLQLAAETYPADASDKIIWKSSNLAVAKVDADGLVSFVKPGVVTITATAADGSNVAASVKLDVYYADRSAKFTAKAENEPVPTLGLETGCTTQMVVYNANGEAMDASLFDFSIPATQAAMASVDENGVITAGEKTGTVTVTAALAGDPLKRKATLSVKIIPVQAGSVVITPEDGVQALVEYVDANGDITYDVEEAVRYNLYFNKADIPATGYKFTIGTEVLAGDGTPMALPKMKYTSTDTGIATVAVAKTGEVTVTVKAKSEGGSTITGTTQDLAKIEGYITVYVHDYAPCLENAKPTLNPQLSAGTELVLAPSHGNEILGAELLVAQVVDRVTQYLPSEILTLTGTDDSNVWVLNNEDAFGEATEIKNSTLKAQLVVTTMEGEYILPFTITVKNVKPAVTTKQLSKFNLFYTDSEAELAVSVKNEDVVDAYFATSTFESEYNGETDSLILRYAFPSNPKDGYVSGKAVAKGRLYVWLDGYNWPMEKDVTVSAVTTKPGLKLNSTAGTVYTALGQTTTVGFDVVDKKTGEALVYDYAVDLIKSTVPGALELNLDGTSLRLDAVPVDGIYKTSTATIAVQQSNWLDPINFTYKVTASTAQPKLTVPTINISGLYAQSEEQRQAAAVLTGTDLKLTVAQQTLTTTNITADAYLDVVYEEGVFTAAFKDGVDPAGLKAGTYSFIFEPTVYNSYGEEFLMNPVTVKVAVNRTAPTFKVDQLTLSSIFTAERSLASAEVIETKGTATLRGDARTLTTTSTVANQYLEVVYEDGVVTAHFKDGVDPTLMKNGTYSFSFNPIVENGTAEGCRLGAVTVKVKVTNAVPSVKLSGTMTLNSIPGTDMLPSSETGAKLVVTASKEAIVKNAAGGANQTLLLCGDRLVLENTNTKAAEIAEAAKLEVVFENGEVSARIIDNTIAAGKYNYKLPIRFVDGGEVREKGSLTVSVTVTKGVPSITVSAKGKLDLLNREGSSIVYTLSSMKNVSGTVTAAELIGADAHRFDYELDTSGAKPTVTLTLKDGETYSTATTYKVAMRFIVSGGMNPIDTKTVSFKVTQGKTTVKASDTKFTVYQRNRYRTFTTQIVLTGPTTTGIDKVVISGSNKALVRNAISAYSVSYCENISGQSVANVTFIVRDTGMLKANATHTLILDVYPEGMASNLKPMQVKLSLAVKK